MLPKRNKFWLSTTKYYGVFNSDYSLLFMSSSLEKVQAEYDAYSKSFDETYYIEEIESGFYSKN